MGCLARLSSYKDIGAKWDLPPGPLAAYARHMLAHKKENTRFLAEAVTETTAEEWREMGRSLWMEASEAVAKCQEAGDFKCLAELIRAHVEVFKVVGVSLGISVDSPLLDKGETTFTLNQAFIGAPAKRLDPLEDGTYPPMRGFIEGRREESSAQGEPK